MPSKKARKAKRPSTRAVPNSGPVWHLSAEEATLSRMPKYNAHACKTGAHGDAKYNRAKQKRTWQNELRQESPRRCGGFPLLGNRFDVASRGPAGWEGSADSARLNPPPNRANERGDEGESLACPHGADGACQRSLVLMRAVLRGAARRNPPTPPSRPGREKRHRIDYLIAW